MSSPKKPGYSGSVTVPFAPIFKADRRGMAAIGPYSQFICLRQLLVTVMLMIIDTPTAFVSSTTVMEKQCLVHISTIKKQTRDCTFTKARKQQRVKEM